MAAAASAEGRGNQGQQVCWHCVVTYQPLHCSWFGIEWIRCVCISRLDALVIHFISRCETDGCITAMALAFQASACLPMKNQSAAHECMHACGSLRTARKQHKVLTRPDKHFVCSNSAVARVCSHSAVASVNQENQTVSPAACELVIWWWCYVGLGSPSEQELYHLLHQDKSRLLGLLQPDKADATDVQQLTDELSALCCRLSWQDSADCQLFIANGIFTNHVPVKPQYAQAMLQLFQVWLTRLQLLMPDSGSRFSSCCKHTPIGLWCQQVSSVRSAPNC